MKIQKIEVSASRTFNHPFEQYSNLKPGVVLLATIDEHEDWEASVKTLQAKAEGMVEDHKQSLLKSIHELEALRGLAGEVAGLEKQMRQAQSSLERIRREHPELATAPQLVEQSET